MNRIISLDQMLPLAVNSLTVDTDGEIQITEPTSSKHHFTLENLHYNIDLTPAMDKTYCKIWAKVGQIPYTAQAAERRQAALQTVRSLRKQGITSFLVAVNQDIILTYEIEQRGRMSVADLLYNVVLMVQETRAFLPILAQL